VVGPRLCIRAAAVLLTLLFGVALAADTNYRADLDPVAHTAAERADVMGVGKITAKLAGNRLSVSGTFSGLPSPATAAHLRMGLAMGVPGPVIGDLTATKSTAGEISGSVTLTSVQIAALEKSAIYVQLDSERAPEGNLWGWLQSSAGEQ
jgi:CHRD domain